MPETAPGAFVAPPSHVTGPQWQSFELRMRKRCAARLTLRAQAALQQGLVAEAEAALQEARTLDSSTPDLGTLRAEVAASSPAAVVEPKRVPAPAAIATVERFRFSDISATEAAGPTFGVESKSDPLRGAAAIAALFLLITSITLWWNYGASRWQRPEPLAAAPSAIPPEPVAATTGRASEPPAPAVAAGPSAAVEPVPLDAAPVAPISIPAPPAREPREATAAPAPVRPMQTLNDAPATEPSARNGLDSVPTSAPPPEPLVAAAPAPPPLPVVAAAQPAPMPAAAPQPTSSADAAPQRAPEPQRVDETPFVRQVLSQYAAAYSSLNASAAKGVWPTLDAAALSRAFAGLESQRVSLGECRVSFAGGSARADCRGSTEWTPKVGGGSRSQPRHWSFDLQKTGEDWRIVDVIVR